MGKKKKEPTFEELLDQTEAAVEQLESGELPLEEAMKLYEQGVRNLGACAKMIQTAQTKVEQLLADNEGELKLTEFADAADAADEPDDE